MSGICGTTAITSPSAVISTGCGTPVLRASGMVTTEVSSTRKSSGSWPTGRFLSAVGRAGSVARAWGTPGPGKE